jgi:hypothetical protein
MRRRRLLLHLALITLLLAAIAGAAQAQEEHPFRASLFYGLGGADSDDGSSWDNGTYQLGFSFVSDYDILVGLRLGQLGFDEGPGGRQNADLTFATVGGEYLFNEGYYTSGVYLGLGWYGLDGGDLAGTDSEGSIGLALGLTGDFAMTKRFSILVELSGHYTELEDVDLLAMGHVGVAFRF